MPGDDGDDDASETWMLSPYHSHFLVPQTTGFFYSVREFVCNNAFALDLKAATSFTF